MQSISYGVVNLEVIRTNVVLRENIRTEDDVDYLFTKWTIDVICQYNPDAMSYEHGDIFGAIFKSEEALPGTTDNAIRNYLMNPRRLLRIVAGGEEVLASPSMSPAKVRYPCDAKNGPFCDMLAINQMIGVVHFIVHCRFTTYVIEYPENSLTVRPRSGGVDQVIVGQNVVVSNRWVSSEDIDELGYPTRRTAGEAVLRSDFMRQRNQTQMAQPGNNNFNADSFRSQFFFPVPDNYQRQNVKVEISSDGTKLRYSFEDVARCYNLGGTSPIRKIEAYKNFYVKAGMPGRPLAQWMSGQARALVADVTPLIGFQLDNLPKYNKNIRVDLWGNRNASRGQLTTIALGVCFEEIGAIAQGIISIGFWEITIRQSLHEKFVSVEITTSWSDDLNYISGNRNIPLIELIGGISRPGLAALALSATSSDESLKSLVPGAAQRFLVLDQRTGDPAFLTTNPGYTQNSRGTDAAFNSIGVQITTSLIVPLVVQILQNPGVPPLVPSIPLPAT